MADVQWWPTPPQRAWLRAPGLGTEGPASGLWWLHPVVVTVGVPLSTLLLSLAFDDADFRRLWRSAKVLTPQTVGLVAAGLLALCLGVALVGAWRPTFREGPYPLFSNDEVDVLLRAAPILFGLTVTGYATFLVQSVRVGIAPRDWIAALTDADVLASFELRLTTIPGLSTLTQFGVAFVIVSGLAMPYVRGSRVYRRLVLGWVVVFAAAVVRAFYLTERLAVLELVVPLIATVMVGAPYGSRLYRRLKILPAVLAPMVVVVFAVFEYSRSWAWYRVHGSTSFGRFIIERFAGYYVTAYNNGQIRLSYENRGGVPTNTLEALWTAPGFEQVNLYRILTGITWMGDYQNNLQQHGNPEFNNESGVMSPFVDYGVVGGLVYLLLVGLLCGWLYLKFSRRSPIGVMLYPVMFLGLLESPRYLWFTQGRATPAILALVVVAIAMSRRRRSGPVRRET